MPDLDNMNDERRYRYLRFKAAQKRRTGDTNGATKAAARRDAARKAQAHERARRWYETVTRGTFSE